MNASRRLAHDWFSRDLPQNVSIGDGSWLYSSFAFLHYASAQPCGVRIGRNTGVYNGTFFELGKQGEVVIGDYCTLVGAVIATNGRVVIDDYAFVAHEVTIADHCFAGPPAPSNGSLEQVGDATVSIGRLAWIGVRAILLSGARIGEGSIVGAGSVVCTEVPPFSIVAGNPARIVERCKGVT